MGICYTNGVIRDFAGPYYVSENDLAFGKTCRYLQLDYTKIPGNGNKREIWDRSVKEASDEYKMRMVSGAGSRIMFQTSREFNYYFVLISTIYAVIIAILMSPTLLIL